MPPFPFCTILDCFRNSTYTPTCKYIYIYIYIYITSILTGLAICESIVDADMEAYNNQTYGGALLPNGIVGVWDGLTRNCDGGPEGMSDGI